MQHQFATVFVYPYPLHRFSDRAFHAGSIFVGAYHSDLITITFHGVCGKKGGRILRRKKREFFYQLVLELNLFGRYAK
jgi:hypothetical protein